MNQPASSAPSSGFINRALDWIERVGNKLPDPALLFLFGMVLVWVASFFMSFMTFSAVHPTTGDPIVIQNQLSGTAITAFLANMTQTFMEFPPLGVVLLAMLGVGVAEHSGYINAGLRLLLGVTPKKLLTPMLIFVAIISHTAVDAGYVLVIPLGGIIFYAAGRHPLAGIAAAFAGVSGGFSANIFVSGIDPMLQGFTQSAAQVIDPDVLVNPLCNYFFTASSSVLIILVGWFLTDRVVEPRLQHIPVDEDAEEPPKLEALSSKEFSAFLLATGVMIVGVIILFVTLFLDGTPWAAANGSLTDFTSPIMRAIVPLIFLLFIIPGVVYGYRAGTFKSSKTMIEHMSKAMSDMGYYVVMAFFCALFIKAFGDSQIGALIAITGADLLKSLALPPQVTIVGIVFLTAFVNLLVGSASAKWALIGPIFVPMLMQLGISPELTQAAYRVGDSTSNIITPLMPYFPLVVVFCQRYVKSTGIGTLVSTMLPYCITLLITWSIFLLIYWGLGIPLGLQASYSYPP